jgi:hypothetical protein
VAADESKTHVVHLIDDRTGVRTDATYQRVGEVVLLKSITFAHADEVTSAHLLKFPWSFAKAEAESALR